MIIFVPLFLGICIIDESENVQAVLAFKCIEIFEKLRYICYDWQYSSLFLKGFEDFS